MTQKRPRHLGAEPCTENKQRQVQTTRAVPARLVAGAGLRLPFLSLRLSVGNPVVCSGQKTVVPKRAECSPALFVNVVFVRVCHHWYPIPLHWEGCVPLHSVTLIWRTRFNAVAFLGLATLYTGGASQG